MHERTFHCEQLNRRGQCGERVVQTAWMGVADHPIETICPVQAIFDRVPFSPFITTA